MDSNKKVVAIYTRVSTQDQAREGHSLEEQEERIRKICEVNDYQIFKVYTDAGISGKSTENRPAYLRMMSDMKKGKFNLIMAYKMDRISRSVIDFEDFFNEIKKYNCGIELLCEKINTEEASGMMFARMLAIFSQFERELIKERTLVGVESAVNKGHFGGKPPFGYMSAPENNGKAVKQWIVNEEEAKIVREIFKLCISGKSYFHISNYLKEKYPTIISMYRKDKATNEKTPVYRSWTDSSISTILNNKLYVGIYEFRKTVEDKQTVEILGKVPPIITEEDFEEAQLSIYKNSRNYYRSKNYLFTQKLRCPKCNRIMACNGVRPRGKEYAYYKCSDCGTYTREEYVEVAIIEELNNLFELGLALDNNHFPIESSMAKDFNSCSLKHNIRFTVDSCIIEERRNSSQFEELSNIWKLTSYEAKCRFITEYIDNIRIIQYENNKTKITEVKLADLTIRKDKVRELFELKEKNMLDLVDDCGANKFSLSYMRNEQEVEDYVAMLRTKYNIDILKYDSIEDSYYLENAFKYIVVPPKKAIEKYKYYELVLCK